MVQRASRIFPSSLWRRELPSRGARHGNLNASRQGDHRSVCSTTVGTTWYAGWAPRPSDSRAALPRQSWSASNTAECVWRNSQTIDQYFRCTYIAKRFIQCNQACVVLAVGNQEYGFLFMMTFADFSKAFFDRVINCCSITELNPSQGTGQFLSIAREILIQPDSSGKSRRNISSSGSRVCRKRSMEDVAVLILDSMLVLVSAPHPCLQAHQRIVPAG